MRIMLAIRLARTGKKHQAYFRVVVSDSKKTPTAKFIEILGNFDPHAKKLTIDKEKLATYLKNGAQPSNTLAKLLKAEKIELPKWVKITEKNKAPKKEPEVKEEAPKKEEAAEAPAEEAAAEVTEEAPAEEPKAEEPASSEVEKAEETPAEEEPSEEK